MTKPKVALCFFGHVKNFNDQLFFSYSQNIIKSIDSDIDYYLVTFNNQIYYNPSSKEDHSIDYNSINNYFLFSEKIILDINAPYSYKIDNFVIHTLHRYGYDIGWGKNAILTTVYAIRQLYGLYKLYNILKHTNYSKYILCRPDCIFEKQLDSTILSKTENICIPNFNHWYGYNDRFAILDKIGLETYCSRYEILMNNPKQYHSEKYLKYTIDQSKNTIFLFDNFRFRLLRSNGELSRIDY